MRDSRENGISKRKCPKYLKTGEHQKCNLNKNNVEVCYDYSEYIK